MKRTEEGRHRFLAVEIPSVLLTVFCFFACIVAALAQVRSEPPRPRFGDSTFSIEGSVVDAKGRPVQHARLVLNVFGTEGQRTDFSDTDGRFIFRRLPEGSYTLDVSAGGFQSTKEEIQLVSVSRTIRIVLTPGERSEERHQGGTESVSAASLRVPKEAEKLYRKALRSHTEKRYDEALKEFDEALKIAPDFARAYAGRGITLLQMQNRADARIAFEKAVRLDPESFDAQVGLGLVLNDLREFQASTEHLLKARSLNSAGWQVHYELGRAYFALADYPEAEASLRTARASSPHYPGLYLLLSNLYLKTNRPADAVNELQGFLKMFPDGPMAEQVQKRIKLIGEREATAH